MTKDKFYLDNLRNTTSERYAYQAKWDQVESDNIHLKKKHPEESGCVALNYRYKNSS